MHTVQINFCVHLTNRMHIYNFTPLTSHHRYYVHTQFQYGPGSFSMDIDLLHNVILVTLYSTLL